jgi:hypothetical protein
MALAKKKVVAKKVVATKKAVTKKKAVAKKVPSAIRSSVKKVESKPKKEATEIWSKNRVTKTGKKTDSLKNPFAHILLIDDLEKFLTGEFLKLDLEITNIVRARINLILNEAPIGFDRSIEWLDSASGNSFLSDAGRASADLLSNLLSFVRGQYEADNWNEPNAYFAKTARYMFDDDVDFG